jgi:hypothetical protein
MLVRSKRLLLLFAILRFFLCSSFKLTDYVKQQKKRGTVKMIYNFFVIKVDFNKHNCLLESCAV